MTKLFRPLVATSLCFLLAGFTLAPAAQSPAAQAPADSAASVTPPRTVARIGATRAPVAAAYAFDRKESSLQAALGQAIRRLGYQRLVDEGRLSVAVVDLDAAEPRYAAVNGNRMMYAASLPKIAILLGAFDALERGKIKDSATLRTEMTRMIRVSSNTAATAVLNRVGFEGVAATLLSPRFGLYDAEGKGGLWVGKAYGKGQYWRRDPIANLSHGATARQTARFFVMLDQGTLVSPTASRAMKEILGNPGINHKFVRGLASRPGARIFRKSGSWRDYHADAALVERDDARYVVVGIVHDADGERVLQRLAGAVDDLVRQAPRPAVAAAR